MIKINIIKFINTILRFFSFFIKLKKNLVIITSIRYNDNSRYLYEYLSKKKSLEVHWFSRDRLVHNYLKNLKLNSIYGYYDQFRIISKAALVIFSGSKFGDTFNLVKDKTLKYCIDHGTGLKLSIFFNNSHTNLKYLSQINENDYFNFTSDFTKNLIGKIAYKFPIKKIVQLGYPRCDHLINKKKYEYKKKKSFFKNQLNIDIKKNSKIVLYAPTWRRHYNFVNLPLFYTKGFNVKNFLNFLEKNNIFLFYTIHPNSFFKNNFYHKNIIFINYENMPLFEINEMILFCDLLLTDYSTISTDFAVARIPQIFLCPDYKRYNENEGFLEDFIDNCPGIYVNNFQGLKKSILLAFKNQKIFLKRNKIYLNKYYNLKINNSKKTHYKFIKNILNLNGEN